MGTAGRGLGDQLGEIVSGCGRVGGREVHLALEQLKQAPPQLESARRCNAARGGAPLAFLSPTPTLTPTRTPTLAPTLAPTVTPTLTLNPTPTGHRLARRRRCRSRCGRRGAGGEEFTRLYLWGGERGKGRGGEGVEGA